MASLKFELICSPFERMQCAFMSILHLPSHSSARFAHSVDVLPLLLLLLLLFLLLLLLWCVMCFLLPRAAFARSHSLSLARSLARLLSVCLCFRLKFHQQSAKRENGAANRTERKRAPFSANPVYSAVAVSWPCYVQFNAIYIQVDRMHSSTKLAHAKIAHIKYNIYMKMFHQY